MPMIPLLNDIPGMRVTEPFSIKPWVGIIWRKKNPLHLREGGVVIFLKKNLRMLIVLL